MNLVCGKVKREIEVGSSLGSAPGHLRPARARERERAQFRFVVFLEVPIFLKG